MLAQAQPARRVPQGTDSFRISTHPRRGTISSTTHSLTVDPVTFELIRNSLQTAVDEAAFALHRSAFSTNVKTRLDFSCGLFDSACRLVAQSFSQPGHLGIMAHVVPTAVDEYGASRLIDGDGLLVNDPHRGASHFNDIYLITPVFSEDRLLGYMSSVAHHVDVGGGAAASLGAFSECYQEGICLPVVRFVSGGAIDAQILKLLLANVRAPAEVAGDLEAQVTCNLVGARRLREIDRRFGADTLGTAVADLFAYTTRRVRSALAALPDAVCAVEDAADDDGLSAEPVRLRLEVVLKGDTVRFDLTGSDEQRAGPMNSTIGVTRAVCLYATKCLIASDIPMNDAFYQSVEVIAPLGTCVNARRPAACVGAAELVNRVADMAFRALAPVLPDKVAACSKSSIFHVGFGGPRPDGGEYYAFMETIAGGFGARSHSDGPDGVQPHLQNTQNSPIEELEVNYPVEIVAYELIADSGGEGTFRGGLGLRRGYRFPGHEPMFTLLADRHVFAPWGLFGGLPGRKSNFYVERDGELREVPSKTTFRVREGEVVWVESPGGGGWGDPADRDPDAIARDVAMGMVSPGVLTSPSDARRSS